MLTIQEIQNFKGKYPRQLYLLFITEMWERFTFYGMRALLVLFMTKQLSYADDKSNLIYGAYQALVYTMPVFGGMLADKLMGFRRAIIWGGILMALGNFTLAIPDNVMTFYLGMGFIIIGNGFLKPNISSIVGNLYAPGDNRRDAGFSLFYMGINIGATLGSILCGWIGEVYSWYYGFGLAGLFMLIGLGVFLRSQKKLGPIGLPPQPGDKQQVVVTDTLDMPKEDRVELLVTETYEKNRKKKERLVLIGSILAIPVMSILLYYYNVMGTIFIPFGIISLIYILYLASKESKEARLKIFAALVLTIFSIPFWGFYEQGGGSLNLFADRNVDLNVFGVELSSAAVNNAVNPMWVILLSPIFGYLWIVMARRKMEPNSSIKFALGLLLLGLSFYIFVWAGGATDTGRISLWLFCLGYFVMTCGELCLSPIGLSMITKLSPQKMVGLMMGIWFLASAFGQYLAGIVGSWMSIPKDDSTKGIVDPLVSLPIYINMFEKIAMVALGCGLLLLILSPLLKKWMKDVR